MNWSHEAEMLHKVGNALKSGVSMAMKVPGAFVRGVTGQDQFTKQVVSDYHAVRGNKLKAK